MPATRNFLNHVMIETALDNRKCHTNKSHTIPPGERHLAVYEARGRQNICLQCAPAVLRVAAAHLQEITQDLLPPP